MRHLHHISWNKYLRWQSLHAINSRRAGIAGFHEGRSWSYILFSQKNLIKSYQSNQDVASQWGRHVSSCRKLQGQRGHGPQLFEITQWSTGHKGKFSNLGDVAAFHVIQKWSNQEQIVAQCFIFMHVYVLTVCSSKNYKKQTIRADLWNSFIVSECFSL